MSQDSKAEPQPHVDVDAVAVTAIGLAEVLHPGPSVWHAHGKHQLLYAAHGMLHLETEDGQWLLPPQRPAEDVLAESLFTTLCLLASEAAAESDPFCLPAPRSPAIAKFALQSAPDQRKIPSPN